jgi:trk system potassium uptake protein TrkH
MELFHPFSQYVVSVFLLLFGINFSLYYLLLIGKVREVLRSEELKSYLLIVGIAVTAIFICLVARFDPYPQTYTAEEAFRHSLFQVSSIITTTGFSTTDFNTWPQVAAIILTALMVTGAMAGSTAGGVKISRIVIALKGMHIKVRKLINPRYVPSPDFEGKTLESSTINDVFAFLVVYCFIAAIIMFLLAFDPISSQTFTIVSDAGQYPAKHGFQALFVSTISCLSNIGPSFEAIGPYAGYADYSAFSKIILSLAMLIGRLEIFPVLIFFSRKTWKKV